MVIQQLGISLQTYVVKTHLIQEFLLNFEKGIQV